MQDYHKGTTTKDRISVKKKDTTTYVTRIHSTVKRTKNKVFFLSAKVFRAIQSNVSRSKVTRSKLIIVMVNKTYYRARIRFSDNMLKVG